MVITVAVFTRSPTWDFAMPTIPSIGEVTFVQAEVERRLCPARPGPRPGRPWPRSVGGQGVVELLLADRPLGGQRRESLHVLLGLRELGLGLAHRPIRLLERGAELPGVDLEERVRPR